MGDEGEKQVEIWKVKRVSDAAICTPLAFVCLGILLCILTLLYVTAAHQSFGSSKRQWNFYDQLDHASEGSGENIVAASYAILLPVQLPRQCC